MPRYSGKNNPIVRRVTFLMLAVSIAVLIACSRTDSSVSIEDKKIEIRGIYGGPYPFWEKNTRLDDLNVNSIFLSNKSIDEQLMKRARSEGLRVFAEFPALNGKDYVDKHPEAWAVGSDGIKVPPASWFMGVCPTEPGFRQYRLTELRELLKTFDIDGIWLDYLHWHAQFEEPEPILPETCFCQNCILAFKASAGISVPSGNTSEQAKWILSNNDSIWRDWRCSIIAGWVRDVRMIIAQERPDVLLGIFHCPWNDAEFNGARRRILGLDYDMLREIVDVFSPMVYHGRMGRDPEWVRENVDWFCRRMNIDPDTFPKVWPIVQAYNDPDTISFGEFEKVLRYGAGSGATGVMMFVASSVADDKEKTEVMKRLYGEWVD